jgi:hypothetical protein
LNLDSHAPRFMPNIGYPGAGLKLGPGRKRGLAD